MGTMVHGDSGAGTRKVLNNKGSSTITTTTSSSHGYLNRRVSTPLWAFVLIVVYLLMFVALTAQSLADDSRRIMDILQHGRIGNVDYGNEINMPRNHKRRLQEELSNKLDDTANVPIPTRADGTTLSIEERLRYLELKTNAHFNFGSDPFFGSTVQSHCNEMTDLQEIGCIPGEEGYMDDVPMAQNCLGRFDHYICLDHLPRPHALNQIGKDVSTTGSSATSMKMAKKRKLRGDGDADAPPCLVYDFGIRDMPTFGAAMARAFDCEVHAFDPSPVSIEWWNSPRSQLYHDLPNYHFHPYGAGGIDGNLTLKEYDWGQVSIIRYPSELVDCSKHKARDGTDCKFKSTGHQSSFTLPVKTLPTIIKELGHERRTIDILKVDVEGSEFAFLENMFDRMGGCPDFVEQLAIEWHHFPWDVRYGEGSSPSINALATLLHSCGLKMFWQHSEHGWRSLGKTFVDMEMKDVRYNVASFHREH